MGWPFRRLAYVILAANDLIWIDCLVFFLKKKLFKLLDSWFFRFGIFAVIDSSFYLITFVELTPHRISSFHL